MTDENDESETSISRRSVLKGAVPLSALAMTGGLRKLTVLGS